MSAPQQSRNVRSELRLNLSLSFCGGAGGSRGGRGRVPLWGNRGGGGKLGHELFPGRLLVDGLVLLPLSGVSLGGHPTAGGFSEALVERLSWRGKGRQGLYWWLLFDMQRRRRAPVPAGLPLLGDFRVDWTDKFVFEDRSASS